MDRDVSARATGPSLAVRASRGVNILYGPLVVRGADHIATFVKTCSPCRAAPYVEREVGSGLGSIAARFVSTWLPRRIGWGLVYFRKLKSFRNGSTFIFI